MKFYLMSSKPRVIGTNEHVISLEKRSYYTCQLDSWYLSLQKIKIKVKLE